MKNASSRWQLKSPDEDPAGQLCVGRREALSEAGYDAVWTGDWDEDPGDDEILAHAFRERRALVTLDKDFGTLALLHGRPHAGILRLVNLSTQ